MPQILLACNWFATVRALRGSRSWCKICCHELTFMLLNKWALKAKSDFTFLIATKTTVFCACHGTNAFGMFTWYFCLERARYKATETISRCHKQSSRAMDSSMSSRSRSSCGSRCHEPTSTLLTKACKGNSHLTLFNCDDTTNASEMFIWYFCADRARYKATETISRCHEQSSRAMGSRVSSSSLSCCGSRCHEPTFGQMLPWSQSSGLPHWSWLSRGNNTRHRRRDSKTVSAFHFSEKHSLEGQ